MGGRGHRGRPGAGAAAAGPARRGRGGGGSAAAAARNDLIMITDVVMLSRCAMFSTQQIPSMLVQGVQSSAPDILLCGASMINVCGDMYSGTCMRRFELIDCFIQWKYNG